MSDFRIAPQGPFSLAAASRFVCAFTPTAGAAAASEAGLRLAFLTDEGFEPALVTLSERGAEVLGTTHGRGDVAAQVSRILSLEHDARGLAAVGERDAVMGALLAATPGFRPVCFASPYEAAVWGVLAQRVPMTVAAGLKRRLARATGGSVTVDGVTHDASPPPRALLALERFEGLPDEKLARLHGIARAALEGELVAERLRAMPTETALEKLRRMRGVGPWTAEHILLRGAGVVDALPTMEPRVLRAAAEAYGLAATPSIAQLARIAEPWRPFRMWLSVRLVMGLSAARWHGPEPRGKQKSSPRARTGELFARGA